MNAATPDSPIHGAASSSGQSQQQQPTETLTKVRSKRDAIMRQRFSRSPKEPEAVGQSAVKPPPAMLDAAKLTASSNIKTAGAGTTTPTGSPRPPKNNEVFSPASLRHHFNAARINRRRAQLRPEGGYSSSPNPSPPPSPLRLPTTYASDGERHSTARGSLPRYASRSLTPPPLLPPSNESVRPLPTGSNKTGRSIRSLALERRSRSLTPPLPKKIAAHTAAESTPPPPPPAIAKQEGILSGFGSNLVRRRYMRRRLSKAASSSEPESPQESDGQALLLDTTYNYVSTSTISNQQQQTDRNANSLNVPSLEPTTATSVVPFDEHSHKMQQPDFLAPALSNETETSSASKGKGIGATCSIASANHIEHGEAADSFDLRSIHDLPEFAANVAVDPSWNTHKVYFNEFISPKAPSFIEEVVKCELAIEDWSDDAFPICQDGEEKKEKEAFDRSIRPQVSTIDDGDNLDPLGWPRLPQELQTTPSPDPFSDHDENAFQYEDDNDDDKNLLGNVPRSEAGLTDILGSYLGAVVPLKVQRIAEYTSINKDDTSVESNDVDDEDDDDDNPSDQSIDNAYAQANDEEEEEGNMMFDAESEADPIFTTVVSSFTSLDVANAAATNSEVDAVGESDEVSGLLLSPPPVTNRSTDRQSSSGSIPLIAPPTMEKLKKWGADRTTKKYNANAERLTSAGIGSTDFFHTSDSVPNSQSLEAVKMSPPTSCLPHNGVTKGANHVEADASVVTHESNEKDTAFAALVHDTVFAEKVDVAISVAASKFEEQVALGSDSYDNPTIGAFCSLASESVSQSFEAHEQLIHHIDKADAATFVDSIPLVPAGRFGLRSPRNEVGRIWNVPTSKPSPFEAALMDKPSFIFNVLSFLGDPVLICRLKAASRKCRDYITENEQRLMRDAVRLGGLSRNVRPSFWLWVTLEKTKDDTSFPMSCTTELLRSTDLIELERMGNGEGTWHSIIERDVSRSFGNLPPHKSGARLRTDSIVRALVTWGKSRIVKIGVKGAGNPPPVSASESVEPDDELTPTDTVSDWSGVNSVGSFASSVAEGGDKLLRRNRRRIEPSELALGTVLTDEMKLSLQNKLSFILHALAAVHSDVGYCQGEDYVVAHLLRILQDTIRWKASKGILPRCIISAERRLPSESLDPIQLKTVYSEIDRSLVVEETCFRVMNALFMSYGLRHFYWPELRCLKTSCLVFERLIYTKLPVLADHFEHHELNVGLFALGWFQTMFLYLPSMPSATVCHMWDIWLVERSFKIFFRVGCAILFLSQPILLNHELEGMMCYLNTFPDATLLSPDILIPCALQIKVTNRMLMDIEEEVTNGRS